MSRRVKGFLLVAALAVASLSLQAHHGLARFDTTHVVTMKGTVTDFQWINPHAYVYADLKDEHEKSANWSLELGSLAMLTRAGWNANTVKRGDQITVDGFRAKDGSPYMAVGTITLPNGKSMPGSP
jgi:hypothetical protein